MARVGKFFVPCDLEVEGDRVVTVHPDPHWLENTRVIFEEQGGVQSVTLQSVGYVQTNKVKESSHG